MGGGEGSDDRIRALLSATLLFAFIPTLRVVDESYLSRMENN